MSANLITMTVEELEALKEEANKRADELEWKLRLTLTKVRELEASILAALGEPVAATAAPVVVTTPKVSPAPVIRSAPTPVVVPVRPTPTGSTPPAIAPAPIPAPRTTAQRPTLLPVPAPTAGTRVGPPPPPPAALAAGSTVSRMPPTPPAKRAVS